LLKFPKHAPKQQVKSRGSLKAITKETCMRGADTSQESLFVLASLDQFVPPDHPLRPIRAMVNAALAGMHERFASMYADAGRESIAPEWLLRSLLLQVLYSIRSERQLIEQLHYNMLFRWFVGLSMEESVWNHSTFSKNRDRIIEGKAIEAFFASILDQAKAAGLLSGEHFSVDGTLIRAWASQASFRPKDGGDDNDNDNFHGQRRANDTHASTTDPESRLYRKAKGQEAHLSYLGHVVSDNRHGLPVAAEVSQAHGTAERECALSLLDTLPAKRRKTLGADKAYDTRDFVSACRLRRVTAHVVQNINPKRGSAIDQRTTRHVGYAISQNARRKQEGVFGWAKRIGGLARPMARGQARMTLRLLLTLSGFNLVRMRNLGVGVT
jgi:transposase